MDASPDPPGADQRPDHFADLRRWIGIVLIALIWIGYVLPVGFLTYEGLTGGESFSTYEPWLLAVMYLAAVPLAASVAIAFRVLRTEDRRLSWRRVGQAAGLFALGFGPLVLAVALHQPA